MPETIQLRVLGFNQNGIFRFICLETDIVVTSDTLIGAKIKMKDALLSYFKSFSEEELESFAFMRSAPKKYHALWYILSVAGFIKNVTFFFSSKVDYDPHSHNLRLA